MTKNMATRKGYPVTDMLNKKVGRLVVMSRGKNKHYRAMWMCKCSCGKHTVVSGKLLRHGRVKSCGCLRGENHGHGVTKGPEYRTWLGLKKRCNNSNAKDYRLYGGRGVKVCKQWGIFSNFLLDMGPRPSSKHSIDRYPNKDGDYEKSNCRWATPIQQGRNTRRNRLLTINGRTLCVSEWAELTGLHPDVISDRINKLQWDAQRAVETPNRLSR